MRVNRVNYVDHVREHVAKIIGAETGECVFVPNTSHNIATILRDFVFNESDISFRFQDAQVSHQSSASPHCVHIRSSIPNDTREDHPGLQATY